MAVYQSGTLPIVRKRGYDHYEPRGLLALSRGAVKRRVMRQNRIPRKASWYVDEFDGCAVHHFSWYEVVTNA